MKTLIILKGLVKQNKLDWVKKEELDNYFLDIDSLKRLFATPDLISTDKEVLNKAYGDIVYQRFMEILCTRLSKGCLVVVDAENDVSQNILETLAIIFGYTVFYVIQDIPQDYLSFPKKYNLSYYPVKKREELEKEVSNFLNLQFLDKLIIKNYSDILNYWKDIYVPIKIERGEKVLHVSDTHSNYQLYKKLPKLSKYKLVVFHGDYIDGPEKNGSRILMDRVVRSNASNIIWLEGNHELRLRKYLGSIILTGKKDIQDFLLKTLPGDFLNTTAIEFSDLDSITAKDYLINMNKNLRMFSIITTTNISYICTHSGLKYLEQLDPRYIGNVVYGNRNMDRYDREFSNRERKSGIWSIHAHCKYPDKWEVDRYSNTLNLDPEDEYQIVCGEQLDENWRIWQIQKNLNS